MKNAKKRLVGSSQECGEKHAQLNEVVRNVFKGVVPTDLVRIDRRTGEVWVGNAILSSEDVLHLQQQAVFLKESRLWQLLREKGTLLAITRIATESRNWDDVFFAKAMLYNLDVLDQSINAFASLNVHDKKSKTEK